MTLSQYIISHKTIKSQCAKLLNFKEKFIVVEITKDTAEFIRKRLPNACIFKTLKSKGGSKGKYYIEGTDAVLKLISQYQKTENVVEEYPVSK